MLYADDILIFAEASTSNVKICKDILDDYCKWTGQRVNHDKSAVLFSKAIVEWKRRRLTRQIGFSVVEKLDYLGIKLSLTAPRVNDFSKVLDKATKLAGSWGIRHLSLAGRATLISTSLLSIPMFILSHTIVPRGVTDGIEKICRRFLWQKSNEARGMHYLPWKLLCSPTRSGGFGFHSAERWRGPLRARLAWDYLHNTNGWLHSVLFPKYGPPSCSVTVKRGDSNAWKIIVDGMDSLNRIAKWKLGDGCSVSALWDSWFSEIPLSKWPTTVNCNLLEDKTMDFFLNAGGWNRDRLNEAFGWELARTMAAVRLSDGPDVLELRRIATGKSIAGLAYDADFLDDNSQCQAIMKLKLHPREKLFWWRLIHDAIPTADWLGRRGIGQPTLCIWGCGVNENREHVAFGCIKVREIITALANWGVHVTTFSSMEEFVKFIAKTPNHMLFGSRFFAYSVYQSWRARNAKLHGQPVASPTVMAAHIVDSLAIAFDSPLTGHWDTNQPSRLSSSHLWCPPPPEWIKINIDGAWDANGNAGIGIMIRGADGLCFSARGLKVYQLDSGATELEAILAIKNCLEPWMFSLKGAIIEGDNINVIKMCKSSIDPNIWKARPPDAPDLTFLSQFNQVLFNWIPREANRAADFCAKLGKVYSFFWNFVTISNSELLEIIKADSEGMGVA